MQRFSLKCGSSLACAAVVLLAGCGGDGDGGRKLDPKDDGGSLSEDEDAGPNERDGGIPDTEADAAMDASIHAELDASDSDSATPDATLPPCDVDIGRDDTLDAKLRVTADDNVSIWFNGVLVAEPKSLWQVLKEYDVAVYLYPNRRNVIAFQATNLFEQAGWDRGLVAELLYTLNGESAYVNSDSTWKVSDTLIEGWEGYDFDDRGWANALALGKSNSPPWSSVGLNSEAEWLWSYDPSGAPAEKPDNEVNYFRKVFYMNELGEASDEPAACL